MRRMCTCLLGVLISMLEAVTTNGEVVNYSVTKWHYSECDALPWINCRQVICDNSLVSPSLKVLLSVNLWKCCSHSNSWLKDKQLHPNGSAKWKLRRWIREFKMLKSAKMNRMATIRRKSVLIAKKNTSMWTMQGYKCEKHEFLVILRHIYC